MSATSAKTCVCFVTGTRAEFGLMRTTLDAIRAHPRLSLQIIATGMHLDRRRGRSLDELAREGFAVNAVVPWRDRSLTRAISSEIGRAAATGRAIAGIAEAFERLRSDVVLVVGDRVEAFAGAAAGQLSGRAVAHVHGGDRALGLIDDSLRHAITKLAHVHFAATRESGRRIIRLGEDKWRVHIVGAPGVDGIVSQAASSDEIRNDFGRSSAVGKSALLVLHPTSTDAAVERLRAERVLALTSRAGFRQVAVVYPNNDPGAEGIVAAWRCAEEAGRAPRRVASTCSIDFHRNLPRANFLGMMRDAAVLIGNSSSGLIEAASFGTPVIDIGSRQAGRERSGNVVHVEFDGAEIAAALAKVWRGGRPRRSAAVNVYAGGRADDGEQRGTGRAIARVLAGIRPRDPTLLNKLIAY